MADLIESCSSLVVFLLLLDNIHKCQATPAASRTVRFRLQDNTPMDSEIGDISSVARTFEGPDPRHSTAATTTTFSILPDPSSPIARLLWIDVQRGVLKTRDAVDRDALCPGRSDCDLEVNVQVRKPPNSVVVVKAFLTLDDDNDNGPIFSQHDFRISLSEATRPSTAVPLPKATDADSPRNGIAKYALANQSPVFYLRQLNDTGAVEVFLTLISELDRESTDRYELHLVAYDGGQPPRSATATILVDVQDVNDNHPVFVKDSYEASIAENVPPNTFVTAVRAADRDVGANGRIRYELDPNSPETVRRLFHVDGDTGNVTTRDFLDYETTTVHSFMVFARDRGPDAIPGQVRVVVRVLNVNDNSPNVSIQIANEEDGGGAGGEMSLSELAPLRSVVAYIRVRDADDDGKDGSESSGVVNCTLSDDHFQLQPIFRNEYQLVTAKELDRETRPRMSLVVACRDAGGGGGGRPSLTGTASVAIAVEDANDNAPRFLERSYSAEVPEDHPVAEPLLAVSAVDADFGSNADVRYTIEGSDDSSGGITIDAVTGVMRSSVPFDRERRQTINVTVTAADAGIPKMTSSVVVSFLILDVDDEVAKFSQDSFTFTLIENQPAGTVIGQVHAFDADLPPFNRLYYHLPENEATAMFRLDPDTGILYATREFDREVRELERFQVFVCGVPVAGAAPGVGPSPNCSGAQVTVIILDENDNDPLLVYPLPAETIFVGNRFRVGQPVARIRASDLDSGENGRLVFRFDDDDNNNSNNRSVQEEGADYFRLDENSGEILAGRDLARVAHLNLTLHLVVSDCGTPSPRSVGAVFGLIVNETLSPPPGATADEAGRVTTTTTLAEHNLVVVIVIACVSGLIAVLLLVSIFCVLRKMSSSSFSGKPPRRASSDAPPRSAYSNRNGVEAKDIAMTTNTDLPTITEGPRGAIKSSSSSLSAFEDDFPLFYNISHYPEAHIWPESKQYPGSYNDAKDERDSKEGDLRSSSIGRRLSPTLHSSDSGRGSSDDGAARKQNSHPQSSFPNRAQDSETVPSSKESSSFVSSNLLSSFKQPSTIDSRRDGDNNDLLGNNTRHRPNVRQATSQISIAHNNPKKVLWKSLENDRQKVKQLTSTLDDERFCRNHPQLLVDCNAFPIENNCGSFV